MHAIERMFEREIAQDEVRRVLREGEVIEHYPEDVPYPSRLVLGWRQAKPLHVVAADDAEFERTFVITVYEPDAGLWDAEFRRRK